MAKRYPSAAMREAARSVGAAPTRGSTPKTLGYAKNPPDRTVRWIAGDKGGWAGSKQPSGDIDPRTKSKRAFGGRVARTYRPLREYPSG